jgi:hypothetical protein
MAITEAEWLQSTDAGPMLEFLQGSACDRRKARLFAYACCRRLWDLLADERIWRLVEVGERLTDAEAAEAEYAAARAPSFGPNLGGWPATAAWLPLRKTWSAPASSCFFQPWIRVGWTPYWLASSLTVRPPGGRPGPRGLGAPPCAAAAYRPSVPVSGATSLA